MIMIITIGIIHDEWRFVKGVLKLFFAGTEDFKRGRNVFLRKEGLCRGGGVLHMPVF